MCFRKGFIFFLLNLALFSLFAHDVFLREGFYAYKLDNGLEVYYQEDFSLAMVHVKYAAKAGYSLQTPENVGFFKLYSRLFWENEAVPLSLYKDLACRDFSAVCNTDASIYSFSAPALCWREACELFVKNIQHPKFSTATIATVSSSMEHNSLAFARSPSGFINSAIISRVFSFSPWKHDSGMYPALVGKLTASEYSMRIHSISKTYYTPNNSAIFITGPVDAQAIESFFKKELASWQPTILSNTDTVQSKIDASDEKNRLFVLVSDSFSPSMNQLVVQYMPPDTKEKLQFYAGAHTLVSFLSKSNSFFSRAIVQDDLTGVIEEDYTNITCVQEDSQSRIVLQALMQNTNSPLIQTNHILQVLTNSVEGLTEKKLEEHKKAVVIKYKSTLNSSADFLDLLAKNWAYGGIQYKQRFLHEVENLHIENAVSTCSNNPWVFLILHSSTYSKYNEQLKNAGYQLVADNDSNWYAEKICADKEKSNLNDRAVIDKDTRTFEEIHSKQWISENSLMLEEGTLTNGIPLSIQKIAGTSNCSILFTIAKNKIAKNKNLYTQHMLESVVIKALTNAILAEFERAYSVGNLHTLPNIRSNIRLMHTTLELDCYSEDIDVALSLAAKVFIYDSISPAQADEAVFDHLYETRTKTQSLEYQLYSAAMADFFEDDSFAAFFNTTTPVLQNISFDQIKETYMSLLDASRISIVVVGNITNTFVNTVQKSFGVLKTIGVGKQNKALKKITVTIPNMTRIIRLQHTFTTDIPAELAGPAPDKLIPTTDFFDPAHLYLECPEITSPDFVLYRAVLELLAYNLNNELSSIKNAPADFVQAVFSSDLLSFGCLEFSGVRSKSGIQKLTEKYLLKYSKEFDAEMARVAKLQSISRHFVNAGSVSGTALLMNKAFQIHGKTAAYLNDYTYVISAQPSDFERVLHFFSKKHTRSWFFSADTKK